MPNMPVPGEGPPEGEEDERNESPPDSERKRDLWSPEYSNEQVEFARNLIRDSEGAPRHGEEEKFAQVVERTSEDSLAHLRVAGVEIPNIEVPPEVLEAIRFVLPGTGDEARYKIGEATLAIKQRLTDQGFQIPTEVSERLPDLVRTFVVLSDRTDAGWGKEGYSETGAAKEVVTDLTALVEADPSIHLNAEDVRKRLGKHGIKIGKNWAKCPKITVELCGMVLAQMRENFPEVNIDELEEIPATMFEGGDESVTMTEWESILSDISDQFELQFESPDFEEMDADVVLDIISVGHEEVPKSWSVCDPTQKNIIFAFMNQIAFKTGNRVVTNEAGMPVIQVSNSQN